MDRISSFSHQRQLISQALQVQNKVAAKQTQVASGLESTDYKGVAAETRLMVTLESELQQAQNYIDNGEIVTARIETMYSAVSQVAEIASDARTWLNEAISGSDAVTSFNAQAEAALEEIVNLLNTQHGGRYLFGGTLTEEAPVDLSSYPAQTSPSTADASFYLGDGETASYRASPGLTIDYGVSADSSGFEKLIRAMSLAANASADPLDEDALTEAYNLATEALDEILVVQTELSLAADKVEQAIDSNLDYQLYSQAVLEDLKYVDVAAATAELSTYETQLEAAYNVLSTLSKLSLTNYL
jgi:flagellar hook-associated protein 3 FlgL